MNNLKVSKMEIKYSWQSIQFFKINLKHILFYNDQKQLEICVQNTDIKKFTPVLDIHVCYPEKENTLMIHFVMKLWTHSVIS